MSKPTLYMPSKPWAYEYKRKLIPNEVLFGPILALAFLIFMIIGAILDSNKVISSDAVFFTYYSRVVYCTIFINAY